MGFTGLVSAQVIIPMDSAIPADAVTNTWWFVSRTLDDNYEEIAGDFIGPLTTFYTSISNLLSADVNPAAIRVKWTHEFGPRPIYPFREDVIDIGTVGSSVAPSEIAVVLSFQGERQSGEEQARRRGRLFLGPLGVTSLAERPSSGTITTIVGAADTFLSSSDEQTSGAWAVYSRANNGAAWVTNGWVDNAYDVQRRRGVAATSRTTFAGA